jgi:hypothetical protein
MWKDLLAALLCAALGLFLAIEPHLAMLWRHGTPVYVADHDEMLYLGIARSAYFGEPGLRDPYLEPSRRVPSLYAWLQFAPLAVVARDLGLPFLSLGLLWRVVGGTALGASLYALLRRVMAPTSRPTAWALGCTLICLADAGLLDGRTFLSDLFLAKHMLAGTTPLSKPDAMPQYRVVTPLLNLPAFLLLLAVVAVPNRRRALGIVAGSILLALCVYLYFFFWTAAVVGLGLFAAVNLVLARFGSAEARPDRRQAGLAAALVVVGGLVLGAPNIYRTAGAGSDPALKPILERIAKGYRLRPGSPLRTRYLHNSWALTKLAVGAAGLLVFRVRRTGLLWCTTFSGYALAGSALATGLEFENFHWVYVHATTGEILVLATLGQWLDRATGSRRRLLAALPLVPAGLLAIALAWRPYEALKAPEPVAAHEALHELGPLRPTLARLGPDCILAGPSPYVHVAQLLSRCSLLYHDLHLQVVSLIPDREIHERDALDAWLRGLDLPAYEKLSTLSRFGYVEPDDPRWSLEAIRRERIALFRSLLDGDLTLLHRYPPTHLLRPTADGPPLRGGPWRRLDGDTRWTLWERAAETPASEHR